MPSYTKLICFVFALSSLNRVQSAPTTVEPAEVASSTTKKPPASEYDVSQFSEVYDQRQNGTENYRLNLDGVVLVLSPPAGLFQAATLLDPALFEGEYPDLEELLNSGNKPEDLFGNKPSSTSTTTTTSASDVAIKTRNYPGDEAKIAKRKYRFPGFIRPFMKQHHPSN